MRLPFRSAAAPAPALRQPKPAVFPALPGITLAARYSAARIGGDFFDFATPASGHLLVLLLDIAGQREAAFDIAASVQQTFHERAMALFPDDELNESLALTELGLELNRTIMQSAKGVRCAPSFLACFAPALGAIWYINAGHPPALVRDAVGVTQLPASGFPFGLFSHTAYDAQISIIPAGGSMVLVSKGLVETRAGSEEFGLQRVHEILMSSDGATATELCDRVLGASESFVAKAPTLRLPLPQRKRAGDRTVLALVRQTSD